MSSIRRSITLVKLSASVVLIEQGIEVAVLGVSLAEHPLLVVAALGALGFPVPREKE